MALNGTSRPIFPVSAYHVLTHAQQIITTFLLA
jgi:hypothetical protein